MNESSGSSSPTGSGFARYKADFLSSLVVFLVALPLCLGVAIASGVPPEKGILTGIIGGLVVGSLAGCPLQVSGPAAGLFVVVMELMAGYREQLGPQQGLREGLIVLGLAVFAAGLLQIAAGFLRIGQWFRAVSPAVVEGMLAAIGILILASQFHVMLDDEPKGNGLHNILAIPGAVWQGLVPLRLDQHLFALLVGVVTIAALVLWKSVAP